MTYYRATVYLEGPDGIPEREIVTLDAESPEAFCQTIAGRYAPGEVSFGPVGLAEPILFGQGRVHTAGQRPGVQP